MESYNACEPKGNLSGFEFGAATPSAFALATEWLPNKTRALAAGCVAVAVHLSGMIGASVTVVLHLEFSRWGTYGVCGRTTPESASLSN